MSGFSLRYHNLLNALGSLINPATEEKQDDILTELQLKADLTETQPVSAASLPLPTGAATEAKQDTIIANQSAGIVFDEFVTNLPQKVRMIKNRIRTSSKPFLFDVGKNLFPNKDPLIISGRNGAVSTSREVVNDLSTAGNYPYLTTAEILKVSSDNAADTGTEVTSGTATGGTVYELDDTAVDFTAIGVVVGDFLINTSACTMSTITAVATTKLTVDAMRTNGDKVANVAGDTYRVARPASTGAAVMMFIGLDENWEDLRCHVILNGINPVDLPVSMIRIFKLVVHTAGSSGANVGEITLTNNAGTADMAKILPTINESLMAQYTVPAGKEAYITGFEGSSSSAKGSRVGLRSRRPGEVFATFYPFNLFGNAVDVKFDIPFRLYPKTDLEVTCTAISVGGDAVTVSLQGWQEGEDS